MTIHLVGGRGVSQKQLQKQVLPERKWSSSGTWRISSLLFSSLPLQSPPKGFFLGETLIECLGQDNYSFHKLPGRTHLYT